VIDVLELQEKLDDRETRLKAMGKAYFKLVTENEFLKEKLRLQEVKAYEVQNDHRACRVGNS
jgi:hypothetical protein